MPLKILSFKFCSDNSRENKLSPFSRGNLPNSWEEFNSYLFNNNYFHIVEKSSYIIFFSFFFIYNFFSPPTNLFVSWPATPCKRHNIWCRNFPPPRVWKSFKMILWPQLAEMCALFYETCYLESRAIKLNIVQGTDWLLQQPISFFTREHYNPNTCPSNPKCPW